ncbi:hypothetical protein [Phenylobacterium soli]|uniref:Uncharacterized protein n=1 Tax=Phenylobacterium soli TaxID=2170551 RepID=A0A328ALZ0_9CAUL|nr:hypothetical protein [Phenylobacterium soli]RAK53888.1 hypothetical protein DJ017_04810 [Phenylobacterium soli]
MDKQDLREAYEHGRRDERARRKRHPIGMTLTFAFALVGLVLLALAVINGSFGRAGEVVDHSLSIAADRAPSAAANAGQAVRDATDSARAKASDAAG